MRKVFFAINMTADGYCSHTDGNPDDELLDFFTTLLGNASIILSGRTTYQLMVPYWPDIAKDPSATHADREFARVFDSLDMIVFSKTLKHVEGKNRSILRGIVAEEVLALKQQPGKDISIGSLSIASQLSERGLIDEYHCGSPGHCRERSAVIRNREAAGKASVRPYWIENLSIRRRCPSLQKAYVSRHVMHHHVVCHEVNRTSSACAVDCMLHETTIWCKQPS